MSLRSSLLLSLFATFPTAALGGEPAAIPALQNGPLGEGLSFATYGNPDGEVAYSSTTVSGEELQGKDSRSLSGRAARLGLGVGAAVTKDLSFTISAVHSESDISLSSGKTPLGTLARKTGRSESVDELTAGPGLWLGDVFLGARASIFAFGEEAIQTDEGESVLAAATVPTMTLYAGDQLGPVTAQGRLRLYNDGTTKVKPGAEGERVKRRLPAEFSVDGRANVSADLAFGVYVTGAQYGRASEGAEDDTFKYGLGGLYHPVESFALSGGLHHVEARYAEGDEASAVTGNLGGNRVDVGAHVGTSAGVASFDLSYLVPERAKVTVTGSPEQRTLERSEWNLELGLVRRW